MMKADDPNLKPQYRMPRVFGALPGPRNVPKDKQHLPNNQRNLTLTVTALTDAARLSELLPPDCALDGEALLTVTITYMSNIGWLAGHGYAMFSVGFKISHEAPKAWRYAQRPRSCRSFGRISPTRSSPAARSSASPSSTPTYRAPIIVGDSCAALAAWRNFRFFDLEIADLTDAPIPARAEGSFHYKYVPKTGALTESDVEYLEYAPPDGGATGYSALRTTRVRRGSGTLRVSSGTLGRRALSVSDHQRARGLAAARSAQRYVN